MTYTREEAQEAASKLVELTIKTKEMNAEIKDLKAGLKEYAEIEGLLDTSWHAQNGYVEISTVTKYKLEDIPSDIPSDIVLLALYIFSYIVYHTQPLCLCGHLSPCWLDGYYILDCIFLQALVLAAYNLHIIEFLL